MPISRRSRPAQLYTSYALKDLCRHLLSIFNLYMLGEDGDNSINAHHQISAALTGGL